MEESTPMELGDDSDAPPPILERQEPLSVPLLDVDEAASFTPLAKAEVNGDDDDKENCEPPELTLNSECLDDPNFAIICSFLAKFGTLLRLDELPFDELQLMMENTEFVAEPLLKLHIVLLRRVFKSIVADKWERSLAKFGHSYCAQDGWEIERFGYKSAKLATKLRLLKNLLEAQFDYNVKFKAEVNKLEAANLRLVPLGRDCEGQLYWYQVDGDANLRVYREDVDDESWEIVAYTREGLCELISKLQQGDIKRPPPPLPMDLEDSNSNEKDSETKEILRDTGKLEEPEEEESESESEEEKIETTYQNDKSEVKIEVDDDLTKTEISKVSEPEVKKTLKIEEVTIKSEETSVEAEDPNINSRITVSAKIEIISTKEEAEIAEKFPENLEKEAISTNEAPQVKDSELILTIKPQEAEEEISQNQKQSKIDISCIEESAENEIISSNTEVISNVVKLESPKVEEQMQALIETNPVKSKESLENEIASTTEATKVEEILEKDEFSTMKVTEIVEPSANEIVSSVDAPKVEETLDSEPNEVTSTIEAPKVERNEITSMEAPNVETPTEIKVDASKTEEVEQEIAAKSPDAQISQSTENEALQITTEGQDQEAEPAVSETSQISESEPVLVTEEPFIKTEAYRCGTEQSPKSISMEIDPPIKEETESESEPIVPSAIKENDPIVAEEKTLESDPITAEEEVVPMSEENQISITHPVLEEQIQTETEPKAEESEKKAEKVEGAQHEVEKFSDTQKQEAEKSQETEEKFLETEQTPSKSEEQFESVEIPQEMVKSQENKQEKSLESENEEKIIEKMAEIRNECLLENEQTVKKFFEMPVETEKLAEIPQEKEKPLETSVENEKEEKSVENQPQPEKFIEKSQESKETPVEKPKFGGLVSYGSSDSSDNEEDAAQSQNSNKRKAEDDLDNNSDSTKIPKLSSPQNPIVGEAIEEAPLFISGLGSGAELQGGNSELELENQKENEHNETSSQDSSASVEASTPAKRKRGRGRPKSKPSPKKSVASPPKPKSASSAPGRAPKRRELEQLGIPLDALEVNGAGGESSERPVRASRRIAQIRLKEEEERRKAEEEHLAQLKAAQLRKQEASYVPSASEEASEEEEGSDEEFDKKGKGKLKKKRGRPSANGGPPAPKNKHRPWATDSEDDGEVVEEEEEYHYEEHEEHEEVLVFNESDHEFSPESDLGEGDGEGETLRHARTKAKRGEADLEEEEEGCKKCGKGDHPEWILLCDSCDSGWHASCLTPQLWVIPEGEWFCPPCQHSKLVSKLNENLLEYDKLLKRREAEVLRKKRLAFVGISLDNVLPPKEKEKSKSPSRHPKKSKKERRADRERRRRRILSDEELLSEDNFIASSDSSSNSNRAPRSRSRSRGDDEDEDSDGPIYRLRARRAAKTFDYKEYDELINSACRASDEEFGAEAEAEPLAEEEAEDDEEAAEIEEPEEPEASGGKNEAYEKHLKEMEEKAEEKEKVEEEEETDEESLPEKERNRRRELKKAAGKRALRKKRSLRDLDDFSDEDASDEEFQVSEHDDEEEEGEEEVLGDEESDDWSGDKDDSDDSLAKGRGKKGRRDEYLEVNSIRRSTRTRRKAKVAYDESEDEEEDEGGDKWNSASEEEEEDDETPSESDDETYGKAKKKKRGSSSAKRSGSTPRFLMGANILQGAGAKSAKTKKKSGAKKQKRRGDDEEVDRAWSSSQGSKAKKSAAEEKVERRTRGRKINFKDILDSGESDDDGNVLPKRRRISGSGGSDDEAEASRRLAEKIKAANQREAAMYAARQKAQTTASNSDSNNSNNASDPPSNQTTQISAASAISAVAAIAVPHPVEIVATPPPVIPSPVEKIEEVEPKPVPAPPLPPSLVKSLAQTAAKPKEKKTKKPQPQLVTVPPPTTTSAAAVVTSIHGNQLSSSPSGLSVVGAPIMASSLPPVTISSSASSNKKSQNQSPGPIPVSTPPSLMAQLQQQPPIPLDITRVPNPSLFQGNPAMRPFHPMWVRNTGGGGSPYGPGPPSIGKPPPLNSASAFAMGGQSHPSSRPGYPSPPPLRIPNPSNSQLQAFQQFRREAAAAAMYRQPSGVGGIQGLLAAGFQGGSERFFGAPNPYAAAAYGLAMPPQGPPPPQGLFGTFDFRHGPESFKDTISPPTSSPLSNSKDESVGPAQPPPSESEFGGLVSYFSSQRTEDDMDN